MINFWYPLPNATEPWHAVFMRLMIVSAAAHMMVVAANPEAAAAGMQILREGGTAVDAAVAVQAVLGLVEPQACGIGGGALMVQYDAKSKKITYFDGRETAPASATPHQFFGADGKRWDFITALLSGHSVGVPGAIAMLAQAQHEHGRLAWSKLFAPAIALAKNGFTVAPRLAKLTAWDRRGISERPDLAAILMPGGSPPVAGSKQKNPAYAATLEEIAKLGPKALSEGPIADAIIKAVNAGPDGGAMTRADLANYKPLEREAVCGPYRSYVVCSAAPPSAGGIYALQTLGMLSHYDLAAAPMNSTSTAMLILESEKLAAADRDGFGGDPEFVHVPVKGLIDPHYIAARGKLIDPHHAIADAQPGSPLDDAPPPAQPRQPEHGTSDVAIIDAAGNAISMTTTVESIFGSHRATHGFVLNNELTDFSFEPQVNGKNLANRVEPGKRPRSSMAPSMVFDRNMRLVAVAGSAGGMSIPGYVVQALIGVLDYKMPPLAALAQSHIGFSEVAELEAGTPVAALAPALRALGEVIDVTPMTSGSALIVVGKDGALQGAADPRRDGVALGQ